MASSGEDVALAVDTQLKSAGSWADVYLGYGIRELEEHRTWPRIVWVPIGGSIVQTKYVGGRPSNLMFFNKTRTKQLRSAALEHHIFIHYDTYENVELLWKAFVASCVIEALGSIQLGSFQWITEAPSHDHAIDGFMLRQSMTVRIPINEADIATKAITGQGKTVTFSGHAGGGDVDVCT